MNGYLVIQNRQRFRRVNTRHLRRIALAAVHTLWPHHTFDLGISLFDSPGMTRLNEMFLRHKGSTDVITFDYSLPGSRVKGQGFEVSPEHASPAVHGEIFICVDEAVAQARRYRTTWQSEAARYVIHGLLHLKGFSDRSAAARRRMKHEEDRLLKEAARGFALSKLAATPRVSP